MIMIIVRGGHWDRVHSSIPRLHALEQVVTHLHTYKSLLTPPQPPLSPSATSAVIQSIPPVPSAYHTNLQLRSYVACVTSASVTSASVTSFICSPQCHAMPCHLNCWSVYHASFASIRSISSLRFLARSSSLSLRARMRAYPSPHSFRCDLISFSHRRILLAWLCCLAIHSRRERLCHLSALALHQYLCPPRCSAPTRNNTLSS